MQRRVFLSLAPSLALASQQPRREKFQFIHFTDTHIQPELKADQGCRQAFSRINETGGDFCLSGGDLVFDVFEQGPTRAKKLFDLYAGARKSLRMPVHTVPGNHDVYGIANQSGVAASDPLYGKKLFEDRIGPRYSAFAHKGWQFVLLDSVFVTPEKKYIGRIDDEQLDWLRSTLARVPKGTPIVAMTHIPLLSSAMQIMAEPSADSAPILVTNAKDVLQAFAGHQLRAVLQGHTHIRETVLYNGCQFITSGAVSGNWWKGERLGHPEGYGVVSVDGDTLTWRYETYGWQAATA